MTNLICTPGWCIVSFSELTTIPASFANGRGRQTVHFQRQRKLLYLNLACNEESFLSKRSGVFDLFMRTTEMIGASSLKK